ncbi:hypothetical protein [Robiginitalea sp. SC105]|uniref:hypothetical protein n=1 Tax=Robiginitalea sp. SC105 TaxID=2762332 RepID=UPI00163A84F1|nr:hypothetical protein [Robiginitalea sp. SC105]MBC2838435.1 hypothetical protein [Robiginitalea sp. SC105]
MTRKKRHWFWNALLIVCLVVCGLAFTAHYRNWARLEADRMQLLSGIYYVDLPYADIDNLVWVEKIPKMERQSGFSAWALEKGVFTDSLNPGQRVYVLVDDLRQQKIRVRYRDSLTLFLNFADSAETRSVYALLEAKQKEYKPVAR